MQVSQKRKTFSQLSAAFLKSVSIKNRILFIGNQSVKKQSQDFAC